MSEFLAEASVLVRPDTTKFRAELLAQLKAIKIPPITVPIAAVGAGLASATAATAGLSAVQEAAEASSLGLAGAAQVESTAFGKQAVVLQATTIATEELALAQGAAAKAGRSAAAAAVGGASASARLDAALLGVRSAAGSAAVIGLGALALTAIVVGKAFRSLVGLTSQFETELFTFQATTGATADEMKRVSDAAKELGADITLPAVSAGDAAEAMVELSKAGLSVQDSIDGARGVLQLATAAAISNAAAVELAASAINAFELSGRDAVRVADVLANAANSAQGSIADMGIALAQAAAVGRQVGLSFEDTSAFLTILAKNGLRGSDAGTSLRTALIRLLNPTDEAKKKIAELGVVLRDTQGNLRVDIFQQFTTALRDVTPAVRDQTLALIGGQDAVRAFAILGRQSIKTLLEFRTELRKQGTAAEVAAAKTQGLAGAGSALASTLETVGIQLGQKLSPGLVSVTDSITASVNALASSEGVTAGLSASFGAVGIALSSVGTAAALTAGPVLGLANAFGQLASAIGAAPLLAAAAAFLALRKTLTLAGGFFIPALGVGITNLTASVRELATALKLAFAAGTAQAGAAALARSLVLLRTGFAAAAAAAAGFLTSVTGIGLIAAVAAGALIFLITRESAAERATRKLQEATDALAESLARSKTATEGVAGAQRGADVGRLAVDQARLAAAQARASLASSVAAKGSIERRQLEIALAVAIQNVTFATQDYDKALSDLAASQEESSAASEERRRRIQDEITTTQSLIAQIQKRIDIAKAQERASGGVFATRAIARIDTKGLQEAIQLLREQGKADSESTDAFVRNIGIRKVLLASVLAQLKDLKDLTDEEINLVFNVDQRNIVQVATQLAKELGIRGKEAVARFVAGFLAGLPTLGTEAQAFFVGKLGSFIDAPARQAGIRAVDSFADGFIDQAKARAKEMSDALLEGIRQAQTEAERAATRLDIAVAGGAGQQQQLALLREQLAAREREFQRAKRLLGRGETPSRREAFGQAAADRRQAFEAVRAQEEEIARDAETAAGKIVEARTKADQKIIDAFTAGRRKTENLLKRAGGTEGLRDDLKFTLQLKAIIREQIKQARERIKDATTRNEVINDLNDRLIDLELKRQDLQQDLADRLRQKREQALEGLRLEIQIAEVKGQTNRQKKLLQAEIALLRQRIKNAQAGSIERKRLRLELAQAQKELEDLRKQEKKRGDAFKELTFQFLQTQQGFAANLLGNLIPQGATAGLVGNVSPGGVPPSREVEREAQIREGRDRGVSSGQGSTQIQILRQILHALQALNGRAGHPEARYQRATGSATMDVM